MLPSFLFPAGDSAAKLGIVSIVIVTYTLIFVLTLASERFTMLEKTENAMFRVSCRMEPRMEEGRKRLGLPLPLQIANRLE